MDHVKHIGPAYIEQTFRAKADVDWWDRFDGCFARSVWAAPLRYANGFSYCGPFEGYAEDPNSAFMTRLL